MTDAEPDRAQAQTRRSGSRPTANHPLPLRPMAHVHPEPAEAVVQLAEALRAAERAHRAYLAELRLGDVDPAEDWSIWYAEYLLGQRNG